MAVPLQLASFLSLLAFAWSIPIDNGVKGYPHVTCGPHSVRVDIDVERPFTGRVYVKGESHRKECVRSFGHDYSPPAPAYGRGSPANTPPAAYGPNQIGVDLKFGECNMRRQRTLQPRGVEYTFTLVVSFHPLFLTKVDRAYRVRCFYMEAIKTVQTQLDVSMLTTRAVDQQFPMPQCHYHLKSAYEGDYLRYAKVGDKVVHVWQCDKVAGYVFGILVHSCYVDDGQGNKAQLIDKNGCTTDKHLIPNLTYDDHLISAHVKSHVFKYADKPHLFFTCTIQLCFKNDGGCNGITPPKCGYGPHPVPVPAPPPPPKYPVAPIRPPHPVPQAPPKGQFGGHFAPQPVARPIRPLHRLGPHGPVPNLPPYKDQPIEKEAASEEQATSKQKRALDEKETSESRKLVESEKIEADFSAPALVVLPFDADEDEDNASFGRGGERTVRSRFGRSRPAIWSQGHISLPAAGVCLSSSGFGILSALFLVLVVLSAVLTVLLVKRQWMNGSKA